METTKSAAFVGGVLVSAGLMIRAWGQAEGAERAVAGKACNSGEEERKRRERETRLVG